MTEPETYCFADDGCFPNSPRPLVIYRAALPADADAMEQHFATLGWSNAWRHGIDPFHHFHSIPHEVLGIASRGMRVMFSGPVGQEVTVQAVDVMVIPASIAHRNMGQSPDLLVVGSYPGGVDWDLWRGDLAEHAAALRAVAAVPRPECDPVFRNARAESSSPSQGVRPPFSGLPTYRDRSLGRARPP